MLSLRQSLIVLCVFLFDDLDVVVDIFDLVVRTVDTFVSIVAIIIVKVQVFVAVIGVPVVIFEIVLVSTDVTVVILDGFLDANLQISVQNGILISRITSWLFIDIPPSCPPGL